MTENIPTIAAIVLAAGASRRMGSSKMMLPFHGSTVLGTILTTLHKSGVDALVTVIGRDRVQVETVLESLPFMVIRAYNPNFERTEMLESLKIGMAALPKDADAFLVVLGDQPQMQEEVVRKIIVEYASSRQDLIIPSFQLHRGHPWLIGMALWQSLISMPPDQTMRDFLRQNQERIHYLVVDTYSILQDMDTPEDYRTALNGQ